MPFQVVMESFKAANIVFHLADKGAEHLRDQVFTSKGKGGGYLVQLPRADYVESVLTNLRAPAGAPAMSSANVAEQPFLRRSTKVSMQAVLLLHSFMAE
jgi:hypothetical protein